MDAREARRLVLTAQGFGAASSTVRKVIGRLHQFQLDPISVVQRAQYMPLFSRLGPYDIAAFDRTVYQRRAMWEYIGHEAALLSIDLYPLMRWRMAAFLQSRRWVDWMPDGFVQRILDDIRDRGPVAIGDLTDPGVWMTNDGGWRSRSGTYALRWLTASGQIVVAARKRNQPLYDLPGRVIPTAVLEADAPDVDTARAALLEKAAASLGVATARELADYFRIGSGIPGAAERPTYPEALPLRALIAQLVEENRLVPVTVEGWREPGYVVPGARAATVDACALLSPFDPLIWERKRVARIFGFRYLIEIYVPAHKRQWGYYVLPFLLGDELVGRVDLKADRSSSALSVLGVWFEDGAPPAARERLDAALRSLADWLGLENVRFAPSAV